MGTLIVPLTDTQLARVRRACGTEQKTGRDATDDEVAQFITDYLKGIVLATENNAAMEQAMLSVPVWDVIA